MSDNEFTRFDPTDAERESLKRIHGAYDGPTALRQLREYPLAEKDVRHYTDHTGRFFEDWSPERAAQAEKDAANDPIFQSLRQAIDEEIAKQIVAELRVAK